MGGPTPRTALSRGRDVETRLQLLELRPLILPERLASALASVSDANELVGTGSFWVTPTTPNSPPSASHFVIDQYELDSNSRYQIASRISTPAAHIFTERWTRMRTGTTWTAWNPISLQTTSFIPTLGSGLTLGNGIISGSYSIADGVLFARITLAIGSTTVIGSQITFAHAPIPYTGATRSAGICRMTDSSAGVIYPGTVLVNSSAVYARVSGTPAGATGTVIQQEYTTSANVPFTWATGDVLILDYDYAIL